MTRLIELVRRCIPKLRRRDKHNNNLDRLRWQLSLLEDLRERILAGDAPVATNRIDAANALMEQILKGRELLRNGERLA